MKPLYLELCGFNSFSARAVIDFKKLLSGGIFGVFGDTGAGKSTILDCIGFALYGKVNRIGRDGSSMSDVVNYNCQKAEVAFEFEAEWNGERAVYRVERTLSRNRGVQKAVLYQKDGQSLRSLCESPSQVNKKIEEEIIGIQFDDFKKCIALPQGEFSKFLQSSRKDRLLLVSKLFSLEDYGYALYKKVDDRLKEKNTENEGVKGQLKTYETVTDEGLTELVSKEKELLEKAKTAKEKLSATQEELTLYGENLKNKRELESTRQKLSKLLSLQSEMEEKRAALDKLQSAKQIRSLVQDGEELHQKYEISRTRENGLRMQEEKLNVQLAAKKEQLASLQLDEKIELRQKNLARVEAAQADVQAFTAAEARLQAARNKYRAQSAELKKYAQFNYEGEKSFLLSSLEGLPQEDNLIDFVNNQFKRVLLLEEYYAFSEELRLLSEENPVLLPYLQPLIDKYASRGVKKGVDLYAQAEYFKKCAENKLLIEKKLAELEITRSSFLSAQEKEKELRDEGERLYNEYVQRKSALSEIQLLGSLQSIESEIVRLKKSREAWQADCDKLKEQIVSVQRDLSAKQAEQTAYTQALGQNEKQKQELFLQSGVSSAEEAQTLLNRYGDPVPLKERTDAYFLELHTLQAEEKRLEGLTANIDVNEEIFTAKQREATRLSEEVHEYTSALAVIKHDILRTETQLKEKRLLEARFSSQLHGIGLLEQLKDLVRSDKFMEFIAVEYLQDMAANANNLLLNLTGGRYFLVYDKNFEVGDNFNGGALRGVHTLSGGETFLVSLSLALSLSTAIHQKSLRPIEFFFLDEGFGTLDEELVDTVMDSLEKLKNENFCIGIISHVGELKNRLENKITVIKADGEHGSSVRLY